MSTQIIPITVVCKLSSNDFRLSQSQIC